MSASKFVVLRGEFVDQRHPALWAKGGLAVSRGWDARGYTITHVPTCFRVAKFTAKGPAISAARAISKLADWEKVSATRARHLRGLTKAQRKAIGVELSLWGAVSK